MTGNFLMDTLIGIGAILGGVVWAWNQQSSKVVKSSPVVPINRFEPEVVDKAPTPQAGFHGLLTALKVIQAHGATDEKCKALLTEFAPHLLPSLPKPEVVTDEA